MHIAKIGELIRTIDRDFSFYHTSGIVQVLLVLQKFFTKKVVDLTRVT